MGIYKFAPFLLANILSVAAIRDTIRISNPNTPPVSVKGNAFFNGDQRFYLRGVDYQPGGSSANVDSLADVEVCQRDIAEFKALGINTIRVYSVDNSANHDQCLSMLADAGIYLALDVNTPQYSLNRLNAAAIGRSYNDVYLQSVFATVDAFAKYDNTLLFFSGNEVINDSSTTFAAPYIKAVTRDLKQYIKARGYRNIPVGYSAADVKENRYEMAAYMNCDVDNVRSDFFSFNDYEWCYPSSFQVSGWDQQVAAFSNYSIPLFLSEYGCNLNGRDFEEVASLYSTNMSSVYSGGLVYEYANEVSNFGLVTIQGSSLKELPDFKSFQTALSKTQPPPGDGGYKSSGQANTCPPPSSTWNVKNNSLPLIPNGAVKYMSQGAGAAPGNKGNSQYAGTPSTGFGTSSNSEPGSTPKKSMASSWTKQNIWLIFLINVLVFGLQYLD